MAIQAADFRQFFIDLHGRTPFPWQEELARRVCNAGWPEVIDLPTASGKTACIDIALFALAVRGGDAPRRIFFVVDRRVIVSEAHERASRIGERLAAAADGTLKAVADALRELGKSDEPLQVSELRGGTYRDETWVKTPQQPTVVTSTVDQVGSRLLFRGYGVSANTWPLHAGLIANDAMIFLDEAHCSRAFAQTLRAVECYRGDQWARSPLRKPFHVVEMTATPARDAADRFQISARDQQPEYLGPRLYAAKPANLMEVKCRKDQSGKFAEGLAGEALRLATEAGAKRVAVLVNRVAMAKRVQQVLLEKRPETVLVIGRMRPIDRDQLNEALRPLKSGTPRSEDTSPVFVVSTQCLEVGADYDFDVLVSECASIDALLQRFGRLDRLGQFGRARASILIASWQLGAKDRDPIYGEALRETWSWLNEIAVNQTVNVGISSRDGEPKTVAEQLDALPAERRQRLRMPSEDGPILLPAHVDTLVQTSPQPSPEPAIELFLHGPQRGAPDVQVVWRADLEGVEPKKWAEIVDLCPPSSREAMPVQITTFRQWFSGKAKADETESDVEGAGVDAGREDESERQGSKAALAWRGNVNESRVITNAKDIRPGDTIVLRSSTEGWNDIGHIPDAAAKDVGDQTRLDLRRGVGLRLHPALIATWPESAARKGIEIAITRADLSRSELEQSLSEYASELQDGTWPRAFLDEMKQLFGRQLDKYPDGQGYVLHGRIRHGKLGNHDPRLLDDHLRDVEQTAGQLAAGAVDAGLRDALQAAARYHDYGKADVRFQAWLRGGDLLAARYAPKALAKSGRFLTRKQKDCGLPEGFRHELISLLFAAKAPDLNRETRDLTLHLVASHHGRCRPFAPVVLDGNAECLTVQKLSLCKQEQAENAAHKLSSGTSDRFWRLIRRYGWWGLAYLEALLRLADWKASEEGNVEVSDE
ncbi:MAG TPA: type I-U CRISPR-associated helicase/endonuclease Cas3 [Bryobacteraceae bacterium]|nr:type I-U CRISPR-associated helicase/endonuclease Cas3 [Bryobacteraceae bacterium]